MMEARKYVQLVKMHGLGNDYLFLDARESGPDPTTYPSLARRWSDRRRGVGSDGLILILPSRVGDVRMRIFNADGSEAEMCGNGVRCLAKYLVDRGLVDRPTVRVETLAGLIVTEVVGTRDGVTWVRVDMGVPRWSRGEIPVAGDPDGEFVAQPVEVGGQTLQATAVSMGNPHLVTFWDDVGQAPVERLGPELEFHPLFPRRINVEFLQVLGKDHLRMEVWERGAGVTEACGTGACAAVVAAHRLGYVDRRVRVTLRGGDLDIHLTEDGHVHMAGPAEEVCEVRIPLPAWAGRNAAAERGG